MTTPLHANVSVVSGLDPSEEENFISDILFFNDSDFISVVKQKKNVLQENPQCMHLSNLGNWVMQIELFVCMVLNVEYLSCLHYFHPFTETKNMTCKNTYFRFLTK